MEEGSIPESARKALGVDACGALDAPPDMPQGTKAREAARAEASDASSADSESDEELHVVDPSDPRAHRSRAPAAQPTRQASGARSRWDSDESEERDEDLGERVITIDDSDDEAPTPAELEVITVDDGDDEQDDKQEQQQQVKVPPSVKISNWARARFFTGERKVAEIVEDPPLEPLNDFILSDFGSRFRGAAGEVEVEKQIDLDASPDSDDEADKEPEVGAPLFSSTEGSADKAEDKAKPERPASGGPARKRRENRYFVTDLSTKCFNCGDVGHAAALCMNDKLLKPCYYCALRGHSSFECPNLPCSSCLQLGHEVWDCSNRRLKLKSCDVCGRTGHDGDRCPNATPKLLKDVSCMVCTASGHLHCVPVPAPADRRVYCPFCAGNHTLRECRQYVEPDPTPFSRNATRMATKCFRCQQYGHMAAECTNERSGGNYNAGSCFNCGKRGHFASDCPGNGKSSDRFSGRKRGREESNRVYFAADDDDDVDDGYYHVPGGRSDYNRRGDNGNKSYGYAQLDQALPTYRGGGGNRNYSNGDQRRRRR